MHSKLEEGLSKRTDLHLARKIWHIGMGLLILFVFLGFQLTQGLAVALLGSFLILALLFERARLRNQDMNKRVYSLFKKIMRTHEVHQVSGIPYYLAGVILALGIFPKPVAILAVLYLVCGDPLASVFGIKWGYLGPRLPGGKSVVGTSAGIITCIAVGWIFLSLYYPISGAIFFICVLGGLFGGLVELFPLETDDNFTIPVISGFFLWGLFLLYDVPLII